MHLVHILLEENGLLHLIIKYGHLNKIMGKVGLTLYKSNIQI